MVRLFIIAIFFICLLAGLAWWPYGADPSRTENPDAAPANDTSLLRPELTGKDLSLTQAERSHYAMVRDELEVLLGGAQYAQAFALIHGAYASLNSQQLDSLLHKIEALADEKLRTGKLDAALALLQQLCAEYDLLSAWYLLSQAQQQSDMQFASLQSLLRANELESDAERFEANLSAMVRLAGDISANHLRESNSSAILDLYYDLYQRYPQHPRIQYELARAYLDQGQVYLAKPLFAAIQFDPELGALAQKHLQLLADQTELAVNSGELFVPLQRLGSSLLINPEINGIKLDFLLDTGASITSISQQTIRALALQPTGERIKLQTANGITETAVYLAPELSIGGIKLKNRRVAAIDLPDNSSFDGLLGTDVLRAMHKDYSYSIDEGRAALVFSRKN